MRVLFTNESPLIKYGLAAGFRQIGCQVRIIMGERTPLGRSFAARTAPVISIIASLNRTLFSPKVIRGLCPYSLPPDSQSFPAAFCTGPSKIRFQPSPSLWPMPLVDYIFTTTAECVSRYESMGKGSKCCCLRCNPEFHRYTGPREDYLYDMILVATNYDSRYQEIRWFIMPLVERGFSIKIWGLYWDDPTRPVNLLSYPWVYGGLLPYEELPWVYSSAKIVLGVNCDDTSITQTSMRPFEALGCGGGLYLGHYTKAQEALFGDLIFQARNTDQTLNAVETILGMSENERRERALCAQRYVYEEHTYQLRAEQILRAFGRL